MKNKILVLLAFVFISVIKLQAQVHAVDDYYTTTSNSVLNGNTVLANDTGGILTVNTIPIVSTVNGILVLNSDGTFTYSPGIGFNGIDAFTYKVCNNSVPSVCDTAIVIITITPCSVNVSISKTDASCGQCDGTATVIAASGSPPYFYSWNTFPSQYAATASGLCPGTYTLLFGDNSGCVSANSITINNTTNFNLVVDSVKDINCSAGVLGLAVFHGTGGTPPYIYKLDGVVSSSPISGISAGSHIMLITDSTGCLISQSIYINQINQPSIVLDTLIKSSCSGIPSGLITVHALGGNAPYTYLWNPGNQTTPTIGNLNSGSYGVTIHDSLGCVNSKTYFVAQANSLNIILDSLINQNCTPSPKGAIAVHATGGKAPYTYSWSSSNFFSATTPYINNLNIATYKIKVTDSLGCQAIRLFNINYVNNLYLSTNIAQVNCQTPGSATVYAQGGHPPYTYLWDDATHQTTATASNLQAGNYYVKVSDSYGCYKFAYVKIKPDCWNKIKGRVYIDVNGNCIQDSGEVGIQGIPVHLYQGGFYGSTDGNGDYTINTPNMTNFVTVSNYYLSCVANVQCPLGGVLSVNFTQLGDTPYDNNFAFSSASGNFDLTVNSSYSNASPGFLFYCYALFSNISTSPKNVLLRLDYDSALIYSSSTFSGINFPTQHKVEWTFNNLPSNFNIFSNNVNAFFTVPTSTPLNKILCGDFTILPIIGDCNTANNSSHFCQTVLASWDPNSKSVIPAGQGASGNILTSDSLLFYTIHFQNTGNDTAFTVIVSDTLSQFLDPATIVPGAASHPYTFDLSGQGILTFRFNHILLPDSNVNEPASNGYFNYTIRQKQNNPIGSVIENKAYIYFDFNEAVITNTVVNTIVTSVGVKENGNANNAVQVFPNPFNDKTTFVIQLQESNQTYSFELENVMGEKLKTLDKITEKQFSISRNGMANGIYFYKIYSAKGVVAIGKLVVE